MSDDVEDFLAHYGVKGMKWGVRRSNGPEGVSRKTNNAARKDAEEFARAKMFYGQGAGNRRKLIKATVESKSKDAAYKKAFDHHLGNQDLGKHASKAQSERRRKDVSETTGKTVRGVHRKLTNQAGNVTLASAVIAGGVVAARRTGADKIILNAAKQALREATQAKTQQNGGVEDWLRKNGF